MTDDRDLDPRSRITPQHPPERVRMLIAQEAIRQHTYWRGKATSPLQRQMVAAWARLASRPELIIQDLSTFKPSIIKGGE